MTLRQRIPNVILALAVALPLIAFPVRASAQEGCASVDDLAQVIAAAKVFQKLKDDEIKRAIALVNEYAPNPKPWGAAYILAFPDGRGLILVGFGDVVCGALAIPESELTPTLLHILGRDV